MKVDGQTVQSRASLEPQQPPASRKHGSKASNASLTSSQGQSTREKKSHRDKERKSKQKDGHRSSH